MKRIITINSNNIAKSLEVRDLLARKFLDSGFDVNYDFHPDSELIISVGGDGSFLKTIHDFNYPNTPIIGINTGHLGFLPDISPENIDRFIESYIKNDYFIQSIPLLQASFSTNKSSLDVFAINEVVIKSDKSRTLHLGLNINGKRIQRFSGDGMIISTPTGSTAYNYSARGSIVDPKLNLIQLTPMCPINTSAYRSFTSSIILSCDSIIDITPEHRFEDSTLVVIDGVEYKYNEIYSIKIFLSDVKVNLLRMSNYDFWSRVSEKFL